MKERILAVVGALALVAVALVVRAQLVDDGGGGGASGGGAPAVACTPDLMAVCEVLADEGRIAEDPPTLDLNGAAGPLPGIEAWITWDPSPGIANIDADQDSAPMPWDAEGAVPIGAAPLAVATTGGLDQAPGGCASSELTWSCFGSPGSEGLALGVGDPTTADGLARLYPVVASLVDVDGGEDFRDLTGAELDNIIDSPADGQRGRFSEQLRTLLTRPGALTFLVGPSVAFTMAATPPETFGPTPTAEIVAVIAGRTDGDRSSDELQRLVEGDVTGEAIRSAGLIPGDGDLAPASRAGDLFAVREAAR